MSTEKAKQTTDAALAIVVEEIAELDGWVISDLEDNTLAGHMLADVKGRYKRLEKERKKITTPMNAALKAVNALFKAPASRLLDAERLLKGKITLFLSQSRKANDEAYAAAGAADTPEEASAALATVQTAAPPKGVTVRYTYKARIVAEDLLMPCFLSPDMGKIAAHMKTHTLEDGSPAAIPGVLFDKVSIVSSRSV